MRSRAATLVRRVEEREQEDDGDRVDAVGDQLGGGAEATRRQSSSKRQRHRRWRRCAPRLLLRRAPGARKTGVSWLEDEIVHGMAHLPADLEHVLEAGGGDDARCARPCALNDGVGRDGRAMHGRTGDRGRVDAPIGAHRRDRVAHRGGRPSPRRGAASSAANERRREPATQTMVGEGAADIDADGVARSHGVRISLMEAQRVRRDRGERFDAGGREEDTRRTQWKLYRRCAPISGATGDLRAIFTLTLPTPDGAGPFPPPQCGRGWRAPASPGRDG